VYYGCVHLEYFGVQLRIIENERWLTLRIGEFNNRRIGEFYALWLLKKVCN
jgi:hypothetical protein